MKKEASKKEGISVYELCFLILPSIPEDNLSDAVSLISKAITKEGGKEIDSETPFKYDLAYPMSKTVGASRYIVSDAYIGWIKFEAEPSQAPLIKSEVEKINEVLRFLLVKAPRETTFTFAKAKALAKEKEEPMPSPVEEAPRESALAPEVLN